MTTMELDKAKAEAFGGQMVGILNSGLLALMTSIGHRTGLFDRMSEMAPSTSQQIADAASLNERYVREWLGSMVTGRIIEYDPANGTYRLPPEHAASLTRAAGPGNMANMLQFMSLMGNVEDQIVECFRKGGGVPYSQYPKFQQLMGEMSADIFDATLVDVTLPLVPGSSSAFSRGLTSLTSDVDRGTRSISWRKLFRIADSSVTTSRSKGSQPARRRLKAWGLTNADFEVKDAATLDGSRTFDLITAFDVIHDQAQPRRVLKGIADALKPNGVFLCVDIAASSKLERTWSTPGADAVFRVHASLHDGVARAERRWAGRGVGHTKGEGATE